MPTRRSAAQKKLPHSHIYAFCATRSGEPRLRMTTTERQTDTIRHAERARARAPTPTGCPSNRAAAKPKPRGTKYMRRENQFVRVCRVHVYIIYVCVQSRLCSQPLLEVHVARSLTGAHIRVYTIRGGVWVCSSS